MSQEKQVGNQDLQDQNRRVRLILIATILLLVVISVITVIVRNS